MTPIADMIEQMVAQGVPMEAIILAVRTAEIVANSTGIPVDKTAEKRRAYDRERKAVKRNSTGNSTGIPPDTKNSLSSKEDLNKKEKKEEAKLRRSTGKSLPDDWAPSEGHYAEAAKLGKSRSELDAKADAMRLWAKANQNRAVARKADWHATFTGWIRRDWGSPPKEVTAENSGGWKPGMPTAEELLKKYAQRREAEDQARLSGDQKSKDAGVFREGREVHSERWNGIHDPAGHPGVGSVDGLFRPENWGSALRGSTRGRESADDEGGAQSGSHCADAISRMV